MQPVVPAFCKGVSERGYMVSSDLTAFVETRL